MPENDTFPSQADRLDAIKARFDTFYEVDRELHQVIMARLDAVDQRLDALEGRCQQIEIRLRDLGPPQVIPVAEYLPRG